MAYIKAYNNGNCNGFPFASMEISGTMRKMYNNGNCNGIHEWSMRKTDRCTEVYAQAGLNGMESTQVHLTREMMLGGMNEVLPEERASWAAMRGELCGAVRPELDEGDVLEDLRMMAKQGATLPEMREVLENALCVLPSPRMLACLEQLHTQTVRWLGMAPAVLN